MYNPSGFSVFFSSKCNSYPCFCCIKKKSAFFLYFLCVIDGIVLLSLSLSLSFSLSFSLSHSLSFSEQAVTISDSLQMDVVNAFQSGSTIQGALRRQPSIASQHHDVTNISTPTHVVFSSTTASTTVGCECVFLKCMKLTFPDSHT